ncbi:MAG: GWxTD domain-containing protein [Acidobacteria bacterium]|jgi:GWxTD domain-containing protein|nr:GWxTD domain-containing protein [Acidobacteriota bacterium]
MKKAIALTACVLLLAGAAFAQERAARKKLELNEAEKASYGSLAPKYRAWLDMVTHITLAEERKVFLKLANDRDRDAFITIFWLQRDPTPGTPENEFKAEVETRFAYVNDFFKRGAARPGWMTDPGRIYMILGKPNSQERFDEKPGLYPVMVWYYYGDASLGLPTYFNVVFYKRFGTGEWQLYNPALDGPAALLIQDKPLDPDDYGALYNRIFQIAPTLAGPAFSMIPNEMAENYRPSLRNNFVLASIIQSPTRKLSVTYATNFLKYKGYVDIASSANFIDNTSLVSLTREERYGLDMVNVSVRPKKLSMGYNEEKDKYFFNLNLNVSLRQGERIIYQYAKNFEFYFAPDRVQALQGGGVVIHDSFPVIPGEYQLVVFVENSVGREFTYFDQNIRVPSPGGRPHLAAPVLGHGLENEDNPFYHAYKFVRRKLSVDPERTFGLSDVPHLLVGAYDLPRELWENGEVEIVIKGLSERAPFSRTLRQALNSQPYARDLHWILPLDREGMRADYYDLTLRLRSAAGAVLDSRSANFTLSPVQKLAHPIESYKQAQADNPFLFRYALGQQYQATGSLEKAEEQFAFSVRDNPGFAEGLVARLTVANRLKKFAEVLEAAEGLAGQEKFALEYHLAKGTAMFGLERLEAALDELLAAHKAYNSDTRVLNLLGTVFFRLGDMEEALKAFEASLKLNGSQPQVEKAVADVRARLEKKIPRGK